MHLGLTIVSPVTEIAMLARAAFGVVIISLAISVLFGMFRTAFQGRRSGSLDSVDLDALYKQYRRGEISWDDYLRGEVEGARGLVGTKVEASSNLTSGD